MVIHCEDWDELGTPNDIGYLFSRYFLTFPGKLYLPLTDMPSNHPVHPRWFHFYVKDAPHAQLKLSMLFKDSHRRGLDVSRPPLSPENSSFKKTESKHLVKKITGGVTVSLNYEA
jgi:hypothetical protein